MNWREVCGNLWSGETGWEKYAKHTALVSRLNFCCVLYRPFPNALFDLRFLIFDLRTYGWFVVLRCPLHIL